MLTGLKFMETSHFYHINLKLRKTRGFQQIVAFLCSLYWPLIVKQRLVILAFALNSRDQSFLSFYRISEISHFFPFDRIKETSHWCCVHSCIQWYHQVHQDSVVAQCGVDSVEVQCQIEQNSRDQSVVTLVTFCYSVSAKIVMTPWTVSRT